MKKFFNGFCCFLVLFIVDFVVLLPAKSMAGYSFTTIIGDYGAFGINNTGQIVGASQGQGFIYDSVNKDVQYLNYPGAYQTDASGINNVGQVVGWYSTGPHASFLYSSGSFTSFVYPGASTSTYAYGINDAGQIVGNYNSNGQHGFLYSGGSFTSIDYPGAVLTSVSGINNSGTSVGYYIDASGGHHGFLYSDGAFTPFDYPNVANTYAWGINNTGQIVGSYTDNVTGNYHGVLYSGGNLTTIDYPGAFYTFAYGINDNGKITGSYARAAQLGFLATPEVAPPPLPTVPIPAAIWLLGSSLLGLIGLKRKYLT